MKRLNLCPPRAIPIVLLGWLVFFCTGYAMEKTYLAPEAFISEAFPATPQVKVLWLSREAQTDVTKVLGHVPRQLRQRYWTDGERTAWILEEIGKEELITAGFVVRQGRVERSRVLIYRETRGMEVSHPEFLKQLLGSALQPSLGLDRRVDNIAGATLSVGSMERMARQALLYDRLARH